MKKRHTKTLIFLGSWTLLLMVCGSAQAADHYVTVTGGTPPRDGTTGHEYTLPEGVSANLAGHTCYIHAGTYAGSLVCVRSGTGSTSETGLITFRAFPGDECQGTYGGAKTATVIITPDNTNHYAIKPYPYSHIRFEGLGITTASGQWDPSVYLGWSGDTANITDVQMVNCKVYGVGGNSAIAAYAVSPTNCLFENCEVSACTVSNAMMVWGDNHIFRANYIHDNTRADGLSVLGNGLLIELNTIADQYDVTDPEPHQDGIVSPTLTNSIIRYNQVHDFHSANIYLASTEGTTGSVISGVQIYGNVLYNTPGKTSSPGLSLDQNNSLATLSGIEIFNNTIGFCGTGEPMLRLRSKVGTTVGAITIRDNLFVGWGNAIDNSLYSSTTVDMDYSLWAQGSSKQTINGGGSHDIVVAGDPGLVNYDKTTNFNVDLLTGSPAKDAGDPLLATVVTLPSPFTTIAGVTRPSGSAYDIGESEFDAGAATNHAPVLAAIGAKNVNEGSALSIVATATDADGGDVLTYTTGTLPSGASWTAGTRTFAWTPSFSQSGSYVVRFTVTDNGSPNMNDYEDVTITVNDVLRYFLGRKP
jgi:hypothetical protein